jgi:hypothetical protein
VLKQPTENKSRGDTFTGGLHGGVIHRRDVEDPQRPGHIREGLLLDPDQWRAAQHWNLRTPSGRGIGFIEPSRDEREPSASEAPAELRQAHEQAEATLTEVRKRLQAILDRRVEAETEERRAAQRGDRRAYDAAVARRQATEEERGLVELDEAAARRRYSDAVAAIGRWLWRERSRRYALAEKR